MWLSWPLKLSTLDVGFLDYSENLNWTAQNLRLAWMGPAGRGLDMADLN